MLDIDLAQMTQFHVCPKMGRVMEDGKRVGVGYSIGSRES